MLARCSVVQAVAALALLEARNLYMEPTGCWLARCRKSSISFIFGCILMAGQVAPRGVTLSASWRVGRGGFRAPD